MEDESTKWPAGGSPATSCLSEEIQSTLTAIKLGEEPLLDSDIFWTQLTDYAKNLDALRAKGKQH